MSESIIEALKPVEYGKIWEITASFLFKEWLYLNIQINQSLFQSCVSGMALSLVSVLYTRQVAWRTAHCLTFYGSSVLCTRNDAKSLSL